MPEAINATAACKQATWRANRFSLASTAQRVAIIVTLSGGVKHCCGVPPASLPNLFGLFEPGQKFIQLFMVGVGNDQLTGTFVAGFDFHMRSEACAHFFL